MIQAKQALLPAEQITLNNELLKVEKVGVVFSKRIAKAGSQY